MAVGGTRTRDVYVPLNISLFYKYMFIIKRANLRKRVKKLRFIKNFKWEIECWWKNWIVVKTFFCSLKNFCLFNSRVSLEAFFFCIYLYEFVDVLEGFFPLGRHDCKMCTLYCLDLCFLASLDWREHLREDVLDDDFRSCDSLRWVHFDRQYIRAMNTNYLDLNWDFALRRPNSRGRASCRTWAGYRATSLPRHEVHALVCEVPLFFNYQTL